MPLAKRNELEWQVSQYEESAGAKDEVKRFWWLYSILTSLYGDRGPIDAHLIKDIPTIPTLYNDKKKAAFSITICVRDTFSHKTLYGGAELDLDAAVRQSNAIISPYVRGKLRSLISAT